MLKMYVRLSGRINGESLLAYRETGRGLSFGGYCFQIPINGKNHDVNFDFPGFAGSVEEDGTFLLEAGARTSFGRNDYLDDCYDGEYADMGISRSALTAPVLASVTEIKEFYIDCDGEPDLQILSIVFVDEKDMYAVSSEVIASYNQEMSSRPLSGNPYLSKEKLMMLDQIEDLRQRANENPKKYPVDFAIRVCCTAITKCSRSEWTELLKNDSTTEYHKRYYGIDGKRFYC